ISQLLDVFDVLLTYKKQKRLGDGEEQDLHRLPADGGADGAGHRAVVVDISTQHRRAGEIGRHIDNRLVEDFVRDKAAMESGVKRQERDVGGRAAHADLLQWRLAVGRLQQEKVGSKNGEKNKALRVPNAFAHNGLLASRIVRSISY